MTEVLTFPPIHVRETGWAELGADQQDGTVIWLCSADIARVGFWKEGGWVDYDGRAFTFTPTHWKPKPG